MNSARRRTPSPALVISILALIVAFSGGGQAIAGQTAQIAKLINGKSIKKGSIPASRIKKDSLTGTQINEAKLAKVPAAVHADSATTADSASSVAGTTVKAFNFSSTAASTSQEIGTFAGFKVVASCDGSKEPHLTVQNNGTTKGEFLTNNINQSGAANNFTQWSYVPSNTQDSILNTHGTATFTAARVDGGVLTGHIFYDNDASYGGSLAGCTVAGSLTWNN
jgi:hypothetical protein